MDFHRIARLPGRVAARVRSRLEQTLDSLERWRCGRLTQAGGDPAAVEPPVVFIIGCPRSGTTWFGNTLGTLPETLYLNEPRWFWSAVNPLWNCYMPAEVCDQARIVLAGSDATQQQQRGAWSGMGLLQASAGARRIVEKSPTNTARIPWLQALFPNALFLHIMRSPHDMALSLEGALRKWFPDGWQGSPQWRVWDRHFQGLPGDLPALWTSTQSNYERGLLIWKELNRLSFDASESLHPDRYLRFHYETFAGEPELVLHSILKFLRLEGDEYFQWSKQAANSFNPQSIAKQNADPGIVARLISTEELSRYGYEADGRLCPQPAS